MLIKTKALLKLNTLKTLKNKKKLFIFQLRSRGPENDFKHMTSS